MRFSMGISYFFRAGFAGPKKIGFLGSQNAIFKGKPARQNRGFRGFQHVRFAQRFEKINLTLLDSEMIFKNITRHAKP